MIIYYCFHIESGKGYVGKTIFTIKDRLYGHLRSKSLFGNALRKYGIGAFKCVILDRALTENELWEKEIYWISELDTISPDGYNLSSGGEGTSGYGLHELSRKAMSLARIGVAPWNKGIKTGISSCRGKSPSKETRDKIAKKLKNTTIPESVKSKMSKSSARRSLTSEQVREIRNSPDKTIYYWAGKFNVHSKVIYNIRRNRTYKYEDSI